MLSIYCSYFYNIPPKFPWPALRGSFQTLRLDSQATFSGHAGCILNISTQLRGQVGTEIQPEVCLPSWQLWHQAAHTQKHMFF